MLTIVELRPLPTGDGRLPGDATEKERVNIFFAKKKKETVFV